MKTQRLTGIKYINRVERHSEENSKENELEKNDGTEDFEIPSIELPTPDASLH